MEYEGKLNDQRRLWKYIVFGILTIGIYPLVFMYKMTNDINTACNAVQDEDEYRSPNYIIVILLSLITFSIYGFFWYYKQGNRIKHVGDKYGLQIDEKGSTYLLWSLLGSFLFGIGPYVALYLLISNTNRICKAYNNKNFRKNIGRDEFVLTPPHSLEKKSVDDIKGKDTVKTEVKDNGVTTGLNPVGILRFIKGNLSGNEVDIHSQQEIIIGRSVQYCQIILTEQDISRKHCSIKYEYQGSTSAYYVTDYSTFGIIVNDSQKLEKGVTQKLPRGTKLTLGQGSNEIILG